MTAIYGQCYLYLDGQLASEATQIESSIENKDVDAETLAKNWSGITPGPKRRITRVTALVPQAGFEFPYEEKELTNQVVELGIQQVYGSGHKVTSRGFIRGVSIRAGVGQNVEVSFEHYGEPGKFE